VIVFDVAGEIVIPIGGAIRLVNKGLVIDGLSAPAPGVTLRVSTYRVQDNVKINSGAQDIIFQGLRFHGPYNGGPFRGGNNQALPAIDGDAKPAGMVKRVVMYRNTFRNLPDCGPDSWGAVTGLTFQENLWLNSRHPTTVSRPPDQGPAPDVCRNDDRSYCHTDGATWFRNAFINNFERNPKIVVGENLEYVNNVVYGWATPNPTEGGGVGLQINPKSGPQYPFGSMNIVSDAFIDTQNRPDGGCVYGDLPRGTPANNGSKARAWNGNGGMVSRIWTKDLLLPLGRHFTQYNCTTTPGASSGPFVPPAYAQIPASLVVGKDQLESVIQGAGMPWPLADEIAVKAKAIADYKARLAQGH